MKLRTLSTLALAAGVALSTAIAGDRKRSFGEGLPDHLKEFDVDEDGKLDEEERQAAKDARKAAREERKAAHEERRAERRAELDTDGDGEVSKEEYKAAREAARAAHLAKIEERRAKHFAEIAGEDEVIDGEEFASIPPLKNKDPERVAALFDRLDTDDSEGIDLEEFNARLKNHRGDKTEPKGRPTPSRRGHGHGWPPRRR